MVHRDFKPGNIFITKKRVYKIGLIYLFIYLFIFLLIGDYGISRSMGATMTMGAGTGFEVEYI
jgi:serine/threonine protein kinase